MEYAKKRGRREICKSPDYHEKQRCLSTFCTFSNKSSSIEVIALGLTLIRGQEEETQRLEDEIDLLFANFVQWLSK